MLSFHAGCTQNRAYGPSGAPLFADDLAEIGRGNAQEQGGSIAIGSSFNGDLIGLVNQGPSHTANEVNHRARESGPS
jgi:hypothetical protein